MTEAPIYHIPPEFEVLEAISLSTASWGVPKATFDQIWNGPPGRPGLTGKGVIIANLDSGINSRHRLLQQPNKIIAKRSFVGGDIEDDNGHGTMTATNHSAIRDDGDYIGVAPDSQIMNGKVFTARGSGPSITDSVRWAVDGGAHIINYSGGGSSPFGPTEEAINYANSKGVIVFVSSGNAGPNSRNYPAFYKNNISVGATQQNGRLASFSTTNPNVDVAAPGAAVAVGNRSGGISLANGTSFSCPWMAGLAALIIENHWRNGAPGLSNVDAWRAFLDKFEGPDVDPASAHKYGVPDALKIAAAFAEMLKFF
jgi:subtilisin family serine protease